MPKLEVEIWSDVACPWCFIGKRRFERALEQLKGEIDVAVTWRSFELDPNMPEEAGVGTAQLLAAKYGMPIDDAHAANERVRTLGAEDGIEYRLDIARPSNTFDAHRLIKLADSAGLGEAMVDRLFRAYFEEGVRLSDHEALAALGVEVGLEEGAVRALLASDEHADDVRADEARAQQLGIRGVPCYVFDGHTGVSGAQPVELLVAAMREVAGATR